MEIGQTCLKENRGFTFVEILLVLALVLIIFQISNPLLNRATSEWKLELASRDISTLIRKAQITAIRENKIISIRCIESDGEQKIVLYEGPKARPSPYFLPKGIKVKNRANFNLNFLPRGSPSVGLTVRVGNDLNRVKLVVISPVTGRVVVRNE